jgi:hypothetical protein
MKKNNISVIRFVVLLMLNCLQLGLNAQSISPGTKITYNSTAERDQLAKWINDSQDVILSELVKSQIDIFHKSKGQAEQMGIKTAYLLKPIFNSKYATEEAIEVCKALYKQLENRGEYFPLYIITDRLTLLSKN